MVFVPPVAVWSDPQGAPRSPDWRKAPAHASAPGYSRRAAESRVTSTRTHLEESKRLLDEQLAMVPDEHHEAMCTKVRVNREILAAWAAHEPEE